MEGRAWTWVSVSFLGFVLAEIATIPVILLVEGTLGLSHAVGLASWTISRVLLAGLVTLILGRILLSPRPRATPRSWLILALGAAMSAVAWVAVMAWAADDRGYFEPSDVGAAAFLYAAVGGVGVAGFAALIAPPGAARPPLAGVLVATAVTALLVGASAMLVVEDVGPEDAALVAALSLVLVFAGSVAAVVTRAIRREPSPADPSG